MTTSHHCESRKLVRIKINLVEYEISSGQWFIYDLKEIGSVSKQDVFAEIKECSFLEFADDSATHIQGGEEFKSFQCTGANS